MAADARCRSVANVVSQDKEVKEFRAQRGFARRRWRARLGGREWLVAMLQRLSSHEPRRRGRVLPAHIDGAMGTQPLAFAGMVVSLEWLGVAVRDHAPDTHLPTAGMLGAAVAAPGEEREERMQRPGDELNRWAGASLAADRSG